MNDIEKGKLIVSAGKSLKSFQLGDSSIASFLYGTSDAGRLGLFVSAIRSETGSSINRIRFLAGQEGINFHSLTSEILPWLEKVGLCQLHREPNGEIGEVTSLFLAYQDLLNAVSEFYESRHPSIEDRGCLLVLNQAIGLPQPEASILQVVASEFGEEVAQRALQLAKAYRIVDSVGTKGDQLIYAPRVWAGLHPKAPSITTTVQGGTVRDARKADRRLAWERLARSLLHCVCCSHRSSSAGPNRSLGSISLTTR